MKHRAYQISFAIIGCFVIIFVVIDIYSVFLNRSVKNSFKEKCTQENLFTNANPRALLELRGLAIRENRQIPIPGLIFKEGSWRFGGKLNLQARSESVLVFNGIPVLYVHNVAYSKASITRFIGFGPISTEPSCLWIDTGWKRNLIINYSKPEMLSEGK